MSMYDPPQDEYNPYASPRAEMRPDLQDLGMGGPPLEFGIGEILSRSWSIYQARLGFSIGVVMATFGVNFVAQIIYQIIHGAITAANNGNIQGFGDGAMAVLVWLVFFCFSSWLTLGQTATMIRIAREQRASIGDIFSGGPVLLPYLLFVLLTFLVAIPIALIFVAPVVAIQAAVQGDPTTTFLIGGVAVVLGLSLALFLSIRLSQVTYVIIDRGVGPVEAISQSMQLTKGKFWSLFVIFLLCIVINVMGAVALLIGLIFTAPFTALMVAVTYTSMVGKPVRAEELKFTPELDFDNDLV